MLKFIAGLLFVFWGAAAFAGDPIQVTTISNVAVCVLPPRGIQDAALWSSGIVVVAGETVKNLQTPCRYYTAVKDGTSLFEPIHLTGTATTGGVDWACAPAGVRRGLTVHSTSTNMMYCSIGAVAEAGKGIFLNGLGASFSVSEPGVPQEAVYVVVEGTNASVSAQDW